MSRFTNYFFNNALKYPNKLAIFCDGDSKTYKELSDMIIKVSNMLIYFGFKNGDKIGVPMNNSIESVVLFFSAAEIGVSIAPFNPSLSDESLKIAFENVNVNGIIARKSFLLKHKLENVLSICLDDDSLENTLSFNDWIKFSNVRPDVNVSDENTLILSLTSGSTGNPKPIDLSQKNKIDRAFSHVKLYSLNSDDIILAATPLYHSLAERLVIMPLLIGATSIVLPRFTPTLWLKCISEQKITFTIAVSAQLSQISQIISSPFSPSVESLRCIVSSSSLLESHVKKVIIDKFNCEFHEIYGTSETSTITNINFKDTFNKFNSVGKPIDGSEIMIVDDNFNKLPIGQVGEIICKSELSFKGYFGMPKMTKDSFLNDYFKTGDMGWIDDEGYLYFVNRKKDIIITGGINVYPSDIESIINNIMGVEESVAFSYPDERLGEVVALAIVLEKNSDLTIKSVKLTCAQKLADFQQPHKIFFLNELPKNSMGKILKSGLYELTRKLGGDLM